MKFSLEEKNGACHVRLQGRLGAGDDQVLRDLRAAVTGKRVVFDAQRIDHINSVGAAYWLNFLNDLRGNAALEFENCSAAFVTFVNIASGMLGYGTMRSFVTHYSCEACRKPHQIIHQCADFAAGKMPQNPSCTACGLPLSPEVPLEEYARFLAPPDDLPGVTILRRPKKL